MLYRNWDEHKAATRVIRQKQRFPSVVGAIQWPAVQSMVFASATVSFLQTRQANPVVDDLLEAKKVMRLLEMNKDFFLHFEDIGAVACWQIGVYTGASWATRSDGSCQGGIMVFLIHAKIPTEYFAVPLIVLHWSSRRLERMCRRLWVCSRGPR